MTVWQMAQAEVRFEELVERTATEGPQQIVEDGKTVAVVLSAKDYERLVNEMTALTASGA